MSQYYLCFYHIFGLNGVNFGLDLTQGITLFKEGDDNEVFGE